MPHISTAVKNSQKTSVRVPQSNTPSTAHVTTTSGRHYSATHSGTGADSATLSKIFEEVARTTKQNGAKPTTPSAPKNDGLNARKRRYNMRHPHTTGAIPKQTKGEDYDDRYNGSDIESDDETTTTKGSLSTSFVVTRMLTHATTFLARGLEGLQAEGAAPFNTQPRPSTPAETQAADERILTIAQQTPANTQTTEDKTTGEKWLKESQKPRRVRKKRNLRSQNPKPSTTPETTLAHTLSQKVDEFVTTHLVSSDNPTTAPSPITTESLATPTSTVSATTPEPAQAESLLDGLYGAFAYYLGWSYPTKSTVVDTPIDTTTPATTPVAQTTTTTTEAKTTTAIESTTTPTPSTTVPPLTTSTAATTTPLIPTTQTAFTTTEEADHAQTFLDYLYSLFTYYFGWNIPTTVTETSINKPSTTTTTTAQPSPSTTPTSTTTHNAISTVVTETTTGTPSTAPATATTNQTLSLTTLSTYSSTTTVEPISPSTSAEPTTTTPASTTQPATTTAHPNTSTRVATTESNSTTSLTASSTTPATTTQLATTTAHPNTFTTVATSTTLATESTTAITVSSTTSEYASTTTSSPTTTSAATTAISQQSTTTPSTTAGSSPTSTSAQTTTKTTPSTTTKTETPPTSATARTTTSARPSHNEDGIFPIPGIVFGGIPKPVPKPPDNSNKSKKSKKKSTTTKPSTTKSTTTKSTTTQEQTTTKTTTAETTTAETTTTEATTTTAATTTAENVDPVYDPDLFVRFNNKEKETFTTSSGAISFIKKHGLYSPCDMDGHPVDEVKYRYSRYRETLELQQSSIPCGITADSCSEPTFDDLMALLKGRFADRTSVDPSDSLALSRMMERLSTTFWQGQAIDMLQLAYTEISPKLSTQAAVEIQETLKVWKRPISDTDKVLEYQLPEIAYLIRSLLKNERISRVRGAFFLDGARRFYRLPHDQRLRALGEISTQLEKAIREAPSARKQEIQSRVEQIRHFLGSYIPHINLEGHIHSVAGYETTLTEVQSESDEVIPLRPRNRPPTEDSADSNTPSTSDNSGWMDINLPDWNLGGWGWNDLKQLGQQGWKSWARRTRREINLPSDDTPVALSQEYSSIAPTQLAQMMRLIEEHNPLQVNTEPSSGRPKRSLDNNLTIGVANFGERDAVLYVGYYPVEIEKDLMLIGKNLPRFGVSEIDLTSGKKDPILIVVWVDGKIHQSATLTFKYQTKKNFYCFLSTVTDKQLALVDDKYCTHRPNQTTATPTISRSTAAPLPRTSTATKPRKPKKPLDLTVAVRNNESSDPTATLSVTFSVPGETKTKSVHIPWHQSRKLRLGTRATGEVLVSLEVKGQVQQSATFTIEQLSRKTHHLCYLAWTDRRGKKRLDKKPNRICQPSMPTAPPAAPTINTPPTITDESTDVTTSATAASTTAAVLTTSVKPTTIAYTSTTLGTASLPPTALTSTAAVPATTEILTSTAKPSSTTTPATLTASMLTTYPSTSATTTTSAESPTTVATSTTASPTTATTSNTAAAPPTTSTTTKSITTTPIPTMANIVPVYDPDMQVLFHSKKMVTFATDQGEILFTFDGTFYSPCDQDGNPVDDTIHYQYDEKNKRLILKKSPTRHKRGLGGFPIFSPDDITTLIRTRFTNKNTVTSGDLLALSRAMDTVSSSAGKQEAINELRNAAKALELLLSRQIRAELQDMGRAWQAEVPAGASILDTQLPEMDTLINSLLRVPEVGRVWGPFFYNSVHGFYRLPEEQRIRAIQEIQNKLRREVRNTIYNQPEVELRVKQIQDLLGSYIPHLRLEGQGVTDALTREEYIKVLKNVQSKSDVVIQLRQLHGQDHQPIDPTLITHIETRFNLNLVGIPMNHAIKMQEVARDMKTAFAIRPVDSGVRTLIIEGYPTKDIRVKGKSSNWGPQNGFICVNQGLSKKEGHPEVIKKQNESIQSGLNLGHFTKTQLVISEDRIKELEEQGSIRILEKDQTTGRLTIEAKAYRKGQSGQVYIFIAQPKAGETGKYMIFQRRNLGGPIPLEEPVEVVAEIHLKEALTADYDLFFVAAKVEEFGPDDQRKFAKDIRPDVRSGSGDLLDIPGRFSEGQGKPLGAISPRTKKLISAINAKLDRGEFREMVHHGEDAGNPASDMADNFPATLYLPEKLTGNYLGAPVVLEKITILKDVRDYQKMITVLKANGYHFTDNPKWPHVHRPSFDETLNKFKSQSQ